MGFGMSQSEIEKNFGESVGGTGSPFSMITYNNGVNIYYRDNKAIAIRVEEKGGFIFPRNFHNGQKIEIGKTTRQELLDLTGMPTSRPDEFDIDINVDKRNPLAYYFQISSNENYEFLEKQPTVSFGDQEEYQESLKSQVVVSFMFNDDDVLESIFIVDGYFAIFLK